MYQLFVEVVCVQLLWPANLTSDNIKDSVCRACVAVHMSVSDMADRFYAEMRRRYYITPKVRNVCFWEGNVNALITLLEDNVFC
jgi:P-loop containing dynein motor region D4